jgi:hypothetical protein
MVATSYICVTEQAPMVNYEEVTRSRGSYIVSLSINVAGMWEQQLGDKIAIHVKMWYEIYLFYLFLINLLVLHILLIFICLLSHHIILLCRIICLVQPMPQWASMRFLIKLWKIRLDYYGGQPCITRDWKHQATLTFYNIDQPNATPLFDIYSVVCVIVIRK